MKNIQDSLWDYPEHFLSLIKYFFRFVNNFKPFGYILTFLALVILSYVIGEKLDVYAMLINYQEHQDNTLSIGMTGDKLQMSPLLPLTNQDTILASLVYNRLVSISPSEDISPRLASSWSSNGDGTQYTLNLNKNVEWQNGQPFTATDVIYTYKQLRKNKDSDFNENITVKELDDHTVQFNLPSYDPTFWEDISTYIIPDSSHLRQSDRNKYIGTGPYIIDNLSSNSATLEKNTNYFLGTPKIAKISLEVYDSDNQLQTDLNSQKLNFAISTSDDLKTAFNTSLAIDPITTEYTGIFFNLKSQQLINNTNNRKEMYLSLNPIEKLKSPITSYSFAYYPFIANEKLQNISGPVTLTYEDNNYDDKLARQVRDLWGKLGLSTTLNPIPQSQFANVIKTRNYDILLTTVNIGINPYQYDYWDSTQTSYPGLNLSNFSDERVDQFLIIAGLTNDKQTLKNAFILMQKDIYENFPAIYLQNPNIYIVYNTHLKNISSTPITTISSIFRNINNWQLDY